MKYFPRISRILTDFYIFYLFRYEKSVEDYLGDPHGFNGLMPIYCVYICEDLRNLREDFFRFNVGTGRDLTLQLAYL